MIRVLVVMGVSGSGKSTVAGLLARQLGWHYQDGDELHPQANISKMRHGITLQDEDRWPWLQALADLIERWLSADECAVLACSALKRSYRSLIVDNDPRIQLVYLRGPVELIRRRLAARHAHFMPESLLDSQFSALEEPAPAEHALVIDIDQPAEQIVRHIVHALQLRR